MNPTVTWVVYLTAVVGGFFGLEVPALLNKKKGDTLSEKTRQWLQLSSASPKARATKAVALVTWVGLAVWFPIHLTTGLI